MPLWLSASVPIPGAGSEIISRVSNTPFWNARRRRAILSLLHAQTLCGLINVVTKSGGDQFHGSVFEFLRNTNLDARGYFSPERSTFQQNQYGGTFGGPIKKSKILFFGDHQGQRTVEGIETGIVSVVGIELQRASFRWRVTVLALSIARRVPSSTMATFPEAPL
jgi:hypothetical protein